MPRDVTLSRLFPVCSPPGGGIWPHEPSVYPACRRIAPGAERTECEREVELASVDVDSERELKLSEHLKLSLNSAAQKTIHPVEAGEMFPLIMCFFSKQEDLSSNHQPPC